MLWQPETSTVIDPTELANSLARSLCDIIVGDKIHFVTLQECRRFKELELVSFEILVERPQRPVYDIKEIETVTICFPIKGPHAYSVLVARDDFPDTPHQNIVPEGIPCCICVDDRPWQDVRSSFTAIELISRISTWFEKACQGEIHGADQPLDPLFFSDGLHEVILKNDIWDAVKKGENLNIWTSDDEARFFFISGAKPHFLQGDNVGLLALHCEVEPQKMMRMKRAPRTMDQLDSFLESRGVNLTPLLQKSITDWVVGKKENGESKKLTCLLVALPMIDPISGTVGTSNTVAFLSPLSPGEIGEKLGFLLKNESGDASEINYVQVLGGVGSMARASEIPLTMALVHHELNSELASQLSGQESADTRRIFMIGAGSAGSTIAETLVRQGSFKWTITDNDVLLPHNIARHTLTNFHVGQYKAGVLASRLTSIRSDIEAEVLFEDVLHPKNPQELSEQIERADLLFDASASVPVSRWMSDISGNARRICAFFAPNGESAVLMIEDAGRLSTIRDLESAYLREVLVNTKLENHLSTTDAMRYTGACRALTSRIPMASIQTFSGLIAASITNGIRRKQQTLRIWTAADGDISAIDVDGAVARRSVDDWEVNMPYSLENELFSRRQSALPQETGGSLLGIIDYMRKQVDVVAALNPPTDSVATEASFSRGTSKLKLDIEDAVRRSGNQVRYIGEWHSHPHGRSSSPSLTDITQIGHLTNVMNNDGLPAISIIVAEANVSILIGGTVREENE